MSRGRRAGLTKATEAQARIRGWIGGSCHREVTRLQKVILQATAEATPSLRDLAEEANVSDSTLSTWRRGTRVPPPEAVEVLAAVLSDRSRMLGSLARQLEEMAEELWTEEGRERWLAGHRAGDAGERGLS